MRERINYVWRLIGTGIAFASFGLGGVFLTLFVFTPIALLTRDEATRIRRVRRVIYHAFRFFVFMLRIGGIINSRFTGEEKLDGLKGALIIANHPALLDTVFLISRMPEVQCVVKHQLWDNFYLGGVIRAAGYIRNDGDAMTLLAQCEKALGEGQNILIFPEGTRSVPASRSVFSADLPIWRCISTRPSSSSPSLATRRRSQKEARGTQFLPASRVLIYHSMNFWTYRLSWGMNRGR